MAVPGSIDNPHSKGCHKLIKDGAKLVECLDDILNECPGLLQNTGASSYSINKDTPDTGRRAVQTASDPPFSSEGKMPSEKTENRPVGGGILDRMGFDPVHPDVLAELLGMPAADLYAELLELELDGSVAAMPGGRYQRIRT